MARWNFFLKTARRRGISAALLAATPLDVLLQRYPHERRDYPSAGDECATQGA
jgi:hypothetical protein